MQSSNCLRVLLVESDPGEALMAASFFVPSAHRAYKLETANTLAEAVAFTQKTRIDVVLLDLELPDASVRKAFSQIQNATTAAVVLWVQDRLWPIGRQLVELGAQDCIVKSFISFQDGWMVQERCELAFLRHSRDQAKECLAC